MMLSLALLAASQQGQLVVCYDADTKRVASAARWVKAAADDEE
jgi:hypothetical protein